MVPQAIQPIYLDYNGTTPHDPEVIAAMRPYLETEFGNPSSSHWYGIRPKQAVEAARRQVAALLNCRREEIVFTSGGTESNNHAIQGMARALKHKGRHIVTTAFEHPAILEVCRYLETEGFATTLVPVDHQGMVDPAAVE
jgi:cysteine desulfurase